MKRLINSTYKIFFYLFLTSLLLGGQYVKVFSQSDYKLAEQDSLALVAFYWATDGPNWTSNQPGFGFNDLTSEWQLKYDGQFNAWFDGPAKDWFGVRVEKRAIENSLDSAYRVTWIWPVIGRRTDGQNQLNGYLPREVGLLTALEQIRLNGNDGFTWELVPDEIYHPSMEHFDFESCWFGGGMSDELRNSINVRKMNLRYNNFDYIPNWDFLDETALRNLDGTQWLYNSRFSYAILEDIVDHFYSVSPNLKEFKVEFRDMFDVGDEREIVAPLGSSVAIECNDAGEQAAFITYQWFKDGLSKFGKTQKIFSIPSVSASDYGTYKVRITNDYVKSYDQNGNYGEVFTKEIHLVQQPVAPIIERGVSSYNGQYIELYLSKSMAQTNLSEYQNISVTAAGNPISVVSADVLGRIDRLVRIHLDAPIKQGDVIELSLAGGNIEDHNGGILQPFTMLQVENRVRVAPVITSANTTLDGSGIEVNLDQYADAASLSSANFIVDGNSAYQVIGVSLTPGKIDQHISKTILLTLDNAVVDTLEELTVQYTAGNIYGLYGGTMEASDTIAVLNQVSTERALVTILFEDGSNALENLYLGGTWNTAYQAMNDDGVNGDAVANDHVWTFSAQLVSDNEYSWNVYERESTIAYDTTETIDPVTGEITLVLTPYTVNNDSLLSGNIVLNFSIESEEVKGDTIYGIYNRDVIVNLHTVGANNDVFLMGIDEDWAIGRQMEELDPGLFYTDTLFNLTAGDIIQYNYRIGNDWENLSPDPRSYTVKNGPNIIENEFGVFTSLDEQDLTLITVYPNPSKNGRITIDGAENLAKVEVYTVTGQLIYSIPANRTKTLAINLVNQVNGLYILKATSLKGNIYTHKLLLDQ